MKEGNGFDVVFVFCFRYRYRFCCYGRFWGLMKFKTVKSSWRLWFSFFFFSISFSL